MSHTPTPKWTIEEVAVPQGLIYVKIKRGNETHASVGVYGSSKIGGKSKRLRPASVARARAKEIIEACNAYEELKRCNIRQAKGIEELQERLRKALALCEGGAE